MVKRPGPLAHTQGMSPPRRVLPRVLKCSTLRFMAKPEAPTGEAAATLIDQRIAELGDWRGNTLATMRALIQKADPEIVEEWKWNVPVWSHNGIICTGEAYKSAVKLTFAKGASLDDPKGLFTSSLEGKVRRALDLREGETVNGPAFKALIRSAIALNKANAK